MSDVKPGHGWWQATDGRWYPPELKPSQHLVRDHRGATVLARPDAEPTITAGRDDETPDRGSPPSDSRSHQRVGGAIDSHAELYLGRPAGLQNRPAAWLALAGAAVMMAGSLLPWATRSVAAGGSTALGWRDAGGQVGGGFYAVLLAVTVMTISVRCMAGSYSRGWRAALVGLSSATIVLAGVEAVRIWQAMDEVDRLTRGSVALSFGPGLPVVVGGALVVLVGAAAYRVGSPH
ncbi:MAG: hypothetical protein U5K29_05050 [Acidimicrobiales bacterium]|nr:hypothetical protein [Acidimicrobiales bacterium]